MFTKGDQVKSLVEWFDDPLDTTDLVLVWEKGSNSQRLGAIPKSLKEALKKAGATQINAAPSGKGRKGLLAEKLGEADVRLDPGARQLIASVVGDDVGRVESIVASLVSTYGAGAKLGPTEVEPFLGAKSDVPPWELTDAIDSGQIPVALEKLSRMTRGRGAPSTPGHGDAPEPLSASSGPRRSIGCQRERCGRNLGHQRFKPFPQRRQ